MQHKNYPTFCLRAMDYCLLVNMWTSSCAKKPLLYNGLQGLKVQTGRILIKNNNTNTQISKLIYIRMLVSLYYE